MPQQEYENPFDRPLDSEVQDHSQAQAVTVQKSDNGNPFDEPLMSEKAEAKAAQSGTITNDVGNTVIVPKDGESFLDTVRRAAAHGKTVTQDQINREMATAPGKVATVVGAAPVIGAGGAALLAAPGEFGPVTDKVISYLPHLARILKTARDLSLTGFGLKEAHDLYKWAAGDGK